MRHRTKRQSPKKRARRKGVHHDVPDVPTVVLVVGGKQALALAGELLKEDVSRRTWCIGLTFGGDCSRWQFTTANAKSILHYLSHSRRRTRSDSVPTVELSGSTAMIRYLSTAYDSHLKLWIIAADDVFKCATLSQSNSNSTVETLTCLFELIDSSILLHDLVVVSRQGAESSCWKEMLPYASLVKVEGQPVSEICTELLGRGTNRLMVKIQNEESRSIVKDFASLPLPDVEEPSEQRQRDYSQETEPSYAASWEHLETPSCKTRDNVDLSKSTAEHEIDEPPAQLAQKESSNSIQHLNEDRSVAPRTGFRDVLNDIEAPLPKKRGIECMVQSLKTLSQPTKRRRYVASLERSMRKEDEDTCHEGLREGVLSPNESLKHRDSQKLSQPSETIMETRDCNSEKASTMPGNQQHSRIRRDESSKGKREDTEQSFVSAETTTMQSLDCDTGEDSLPLALRSDARSRSYSFLEEEDIEACEKLFHIETAAKQCTTESSQVPWGSDQATPTKKEIIEDNVASSPKVSPGAAREPVETIIWRGQVKICGNMSGRRHEETFPGFEIQCFDMKARKEFEDRISAEKNTVSPPICAELLRVEKNFSPLLALSGGHGRLEMNLADKAPQKSLLLVNAWRSAQVSAVLRIGGTSMLCHWSRKDNSRDGSTLVCLFPKSYPVAPKDADFGLYRLMTFGNASEVQLGTLPSNLLHLPILQPTDNGECQVVESANEGWTKPSTLEAYHEAATEYQQALDAKTSCERRYFLEESRKEKEKRRRRHNAARRALSGVNGDSLKRVAGQASGASKPTFVEKPTPSEYASSRSHPLSAQLSTSVHVKASKKAMLRTSVASRDVRLKISRSKYRAPCRLNTKGKVVSKHIGTSTHSKLIALKASSYIGEIRDYYDYAKMRTYKDNKPKYPQKWMMLGEMTLRMKQAEEAKKDLLGFEESSTMSGFRKKFSGLHGVHWCEDGDKGDWWIRAVERIIGLRRHSEFKTFMNRCQRDSQPHERFLSLAADLKGQSPAVNKLESRESRKRSRNAHSSPSYSKFFKTLGIKNCESSDACEQLRVRESGQDEILSRRTGTEFIVRQQTGTAAPPRVLEDNSLLSHQETKGTPGATERFERQSHEVLHDLENSKAGAVCEYFEETDEIRYVPASGMQVVMPMSVAAPLLSALRLQGVDVSTKPSLEAIAARFRRFSKAQLASLRASQPIKCERLVKFSKEAGFVVYQIRNVPVRIDLHVLGPLYAELLLAGVEFDPRKGSLSPLIDYFEQVGML